MAKTRKLSRIRRDERRRQAEQERLRGAQGGPIAGSRSARAPASPSKSPAVALNPQAESSGASRDVQFLHTLENVLMNCAQTPYMRPLIEQLWSLAPGLMSDEAVLISIGECDLISDLITAVADASPSDDAPYHLYQEMDDDMDDGESTFDLERPSSEAMWVMCMLRARIEVGALPLPALVEPPAEKEVAAAE